jgi:hypothetical protein
MEKQPPLYREVQLGKWNFTRTVTVAPQFKHLSRQEFEEQHPEAVVAMKARMFDLLRDQGYVEDDADDILDDMDFESETEWVFTRHPDAVSHEEQIRMRKLQQEEQEKMYRQIHETDRDRKRLIDVYNMDISKRKKLVELLNELEEPKPTPQQ